MADNINHPTPDELIAHEQERIAEIQQRVEAEKQRKRNEHIRRAEQARLSETIDKETKQRRDREFFDNQTFGMSEHQKKIYKRLLELQPFIESSSGNQREDVKAEYAVLTDELVKEGRIVGTSTFVPATVLVNVSGNGVVDNLGIYHGGTFSAYQTTSWRLEREPDGQMFLTKMGIVEHTNLLIKDKIKIVVLDNTPEPVPNKSVDLFPKPPKEEPVRPLTEKETKEKKKRMFF